MDLYTPIYNGLSKLDFKYAHPRPVNPNILITDIVKVVNKLKLPCKIEAKKYRCRLKHGAIDGMVSGLYVCELDDENLPCVFLCFGIPLTKVLYTNNWLLTKQTISDTLEHEMMHSRQFRDRDYDDECRVYIEKDGLEYLSNIDEIEAYSLNCARELLRSCGTYKDAMKVLKDRSLHTTKYSIVLHRYTTKLSKYPKVLKVFYRWVNVYLNRIEKGTL